jgi:hypothetical protein
MENAVFANVPSMITAVMSVPISRASNHLWRYFAISSSSAWRLPPPCPKTL